LTERAIAAAVEVAAGLGLRGVTPELLRDSSNALVHLQPFPIVARVATTTGWLRQPAEAWLRRDVEVASFLHRAGAAVVPPLSGIAGVDLPPGPHISFAATGSLVLSFWTFVVHDRATEVTPEEAIVSLRELHLKLREFPGSGEAVAIPYMGVVLDELPHWLKWLEVKRRLSGSDLIDLREAHWKLAAELRPGRHPNSGRSPAWRTQVLHGDAHRRNLLRTPAGLLWTDFEDTCKGPVAWDLATFLAQESASGEPGSERGREQELLALYPDAPAWQDLLPYIKARELEAVVYMQVLASRFPDRAEDAARRLELWRRKRPI
jgi:hypothetical protein